jgi:hypothetical protein
VKNSSDPFVPPFVPPTDPFNSWNPKEFFANCEVHYLTPNVNYGCGGVVALRAGRAAAGDLFLPDAGSGIFNTFAGAVAELARVKAAGIPAVIVAFQSDYPWATAYGQPIAAPVDISVFVIGPDPGYSPRLVCRVGGNFAVLLGTPANPFWEYATGPWDVEDYASQSIIHQSSLPDLYTVFRVLYYTNSESPVPKNVPTVGFDLTPGDTSDNR